MAKPKIAVVSNEPVERAGRLLEFIPGGGFPQPTQPVAVYMSTVASVPIEIRRHATELAARHWKYTFARTDWQTQGSWQVKGDDLLLFPINGPRDHHYRLTPIKVFT